MNKSILSRLIKEHVAKYKIEIFKTTFFIVISSVLSAVIVKLIEPTVNQILVQQDIQMILIFPFFIMIATFGKGIAEYYQNYFVKYIGQKILSDIQIRLYSHLIYSDISLIQKMSSGNIISRFANDITLMCSAVTNLLLGTAKHILSVILLIFIMFYTEPVLSAIVFFVFPCSIYPVQRIGKKLRNILDKTQQEFAEYTSNLDESFIAIKTIKSFCAEVKQILKAKTYNDKIVSHIKNAAKSDAIISPIMEFLSGLAIASILWYGGYLIINNKTTPGALFSFIMAFVASYRPFKSLMSLNIHFQEGIIAAKRVFDVLDTKPSIVNTSYSKDIELKSPAAISFSNVNLNLDQQNVLNDISFKISPNEKIAIVGRSGSGKTSIINLLLRFYDASSGNISIDENKIEDFTLNSLMRNISLVNQDDILFDASIIENISYGNSKIEREEIIKIIKPLGIEDFIEHTKNGYDTQIGYRGTKISGGQKQMISIARAIIKQANILILDEATSAIDTKRENSILNYVKSLQKTIIMVTHRIGTIQNFDKIIVVAAGKIVSIGNHNELIKSCKEYNTLYETYAEQK